MGEFTAALNREGREIGDCPITPAALGDLIQRIRDETISGKIAKGVFDALWQGEGTVDEIIEAKGLRQIRDSGAIEQIIDQIIAANPAQVADYRAGKDKLFGFFVGQVMRASQGKANPQQVNDLLKAKLGP